MCVGLHGSGTVNQNSTKALSSFILQEVMDLGWLVHCFSAHRLITGLGIPTLLVWQKRLSMCSNDGCWRMIQNCRVERSAEFLNSDHRLVVATLQLQVKFRRMVPSQPKLDVDKLKDEMVAEEIVNRLSVDLRGLGALGNPERHPSLV